MNSASPPVATLELSLHGQRVGHLAHYSGGRNILSFDTAFAHSTNRPTLTLTTHPSFPRAAALMATPWSSHQRLHPVLSNLLPEGQLRTLIAQTLKTHIDNEFEFFSHLGGDLPGALIAKPIALEHTPQTLTAALDTSKTEASAVSKFSLAGVQMKFSMTEREGRYALSSGETLGGWIIKTPSPQHAFVPQNEFTAMSLAALAGINIPDIRLITLDQLDALPRLNLPNETFAFAIKRFDRNGNTRIHMEDFAQVLVQYPHRKYDSANYEQIARVLAQYSGDPLADGQQFARRLLVNILLANGDAHLKNWSLLYADQHTPRLSPAYDIVTTSVYIANETKLALNLNKVKSWHTITMAHFQRWAEKSGLPWRAIQPHLEDTIARARDLWPAALAELPMHEPHQVALKRHWQQLQPDFRLL